MSDRYYHIHETNATALEFEQEIKLLRAWAKRKCRKSHETLVKNYILFSVKKVRSMYKHLPEDSVMQVAHKALLYSIDGFDCNRPKIGRLSGLIPWYARVANKELIRESETVKCPVAKFEGKRFFSLDAPVPRYGDRDRVYTALDAGITTEETEPAVDIDSLVGLNDSAIDDDVRQERRAALLEAIKEMTPTHRKIIELVYYKGMNFAEVARALKPTVTREAVRQKHNKAIQRLRDAVKEKGIFTAE